MSESFKSLNELAAEHHLQIRYETEMESFDLAGKMRLELETLKNLNATIDQVFDILAKEGKPELLEKLCPYFGVVWPSARALVEVLGRGKFLPPGASVLEMGCGLAIPSLALAKWGHPVHATDFHPEVPKFLEKNLRNNQLAPDSIRYHALDWSQDANALEAFARENGPFQRMIGSDILYEAQHAEKVPAVLEKLLHPETGRALITDPARPYLQKFVDEMKRRGFENTTEILKAHDKPEPKEIFVVEFFRA
jgi:predicted nicotinamide N-methyase